MQPWIGFQISGRACRCRAWRNRPRPRSPIGTAALFRWIIDASTANPTSNSSTSAQLCPRLAAGEAAAAGVVLGAGVLPAITGLAPESGALVVTDGPVLIVGMDPAPALPAEPDCEVLVPLPDPAAAGEVAPLPLDDAGGGGKLEPPPVTVSDPSSGLSKSTDVGGVGSTGESPPKVGSWLLGCGTIARLSSPVLRWLLPSTKNVTVFWSADSLPEKQCLAS